MDKVINFKIKSGAVPQYIQTTLDRVRAVAGIRKAVPLFENDADKERALIYQAYIDESASMETVAKNLSRIQGVEYANPPQDSQKIEKPIAAEPKSLIVTLKEDFQMQSMFSLVRSLMETSGVSHVKHLEKSDSVQEIRVDMNEGDPERKIEQIIQTNEFVKAVRPAGAVLAPNLEAA